MTATFKFEGGRELEQSLSELATRATKVNVARRALRRAAEPIREEWERLVPVDQGDLKRSIKVGRAIKAYQRAGNRGKAVTEFVGVDESEDRRLHIYAEVIEFGNESHPAQPAGRPAWESKKDEALERIANDMREEIMKAAARAARKTARLRR
jgi:HK97 gp10 family phage protein